MTVREVHPKGWDVDGDRAADRSVLDGVGVELQALVECRLVVDDHGQVTYIMYRWGSVARLIWCAIVLKREKCVLIAGTRKADYPLGCINGQRATVDHSKVD